MKTLKPGVRVRYIGNKRTPKNILLIALYGRTGIIRSPANEHGYDWYVEMDEGAYDIDAKSEALEPIDDSDADCWTQEKEPALSKGS